jgi:GT2 family glycosyltransferase
VSSSSPSPDISIVIPNLNGAHLLKSCLPAVKQAAADLAVEVILADNGSTDGSISIAQGLHPGIRILRSTWNQGFARACNAASQAARGNYLLFLNTDVVLGPRVLAELLAWADSDGDAAAWQPKLIRDDGRTWDSAGSMFTWTGFLWHEGLGEVGSHKYPLARDAFALKGACMLVRRSTFLEVDGFDESFFAYFEETDLCWRLLLSGWRIRYLPICCAFHSTGATTTRFFSPERIDFLSFRNRITAIIKNADSFTLWRVLPIHAAASAALALTFAFLGEWRTAKAIAQALLWHPAHFRQLARKRRRTQQLRVVSDRAYLPRVSTPMTVSRMRKLMAAYVPRW